MYSSTEQPANNRSIQLLPEHLIDQIKAGEVIERPSSLVKELVENAVDSGADKISIHLKDNGLSLVSIEDNGKGISFEDLPYAFARHATSKIERFEDLYKLHTYGFRGEALASIASISRVSCQTKTADNECSKIEFEGGQQISHEKFEKDSRGTSIYVRDLFFNTPVRMKFLRSQTSEKKVIQKILESFIISNPQITFHIQFDEDDKIIHPKKSSVKERVLDLLRSKKIHSLLSESYEYDGHHATLFISEQSGKSSVGKKQFLIANNRLFSDKSLHNSIVHSLGKVWKGEVGHYCLLLEVPASKLDVNVHPNKTYIKFLDPNIIYSLIKTLTKKISDQFDNPEQLPKQENENNQSASIEEILNSPRVIQPHKSSSPQGLTTDNIVHLGHQFYLKEYNGAHYLIDSKTLIEHYLNQSFYLFKKEPLEDSLTPILISGPVSLPSEIDLNILKEIGFEFEKVDQNSFMLKSSPKALSLLNDTFLIEVLLKHYPEIIEEKEIKLDDTISLDSPILLLDLISFYSIKSLVSLNIVKKIDKEALSRVFHG